MEYDISNYMRQINRYRFDNVGGLVVDLRADMMELSKKKSIWRDISGNENHLSMFEGEYPEIIESNLNGEKVIRLSGNSLISSINNIIGDNQSYSVFTVARYFGNKQGRVISSKNGNWLFGFHNGKKNSWLSGKEWLNKGNLADFNWSLNSASYNCKNNNYSFFDGNNILVNEISEQYHKGVGKLSVGGWTGGGEEASECEIARILIFDVALSENMRRHVNNILSITYGLGVTKKDYVNWAQWLGSSLLSHPEIYRTASRLYLTELNDIKRDSKIMKYSNYSDKNSHEIMALRNLKSNNIRKAIKYSYIQYFLNPRNTQAIKQLIEMKKNVNGTIESIDLFELMNSTDEYGEVISVKEINDFMLRNNNFLGNIIKDDLFIDLAEKYLLNRIRMPSELVELNIKIEEILMKNENYYSKLISKKINLTSSNSKIRDEIINELDRNKDNKLAIRYSTEYFKNNKRRFVGGFADRIKGAATAMLISIATKRRFEIDWRYPFEFEEIIVPKDYDWRTKKTTEEDKKIVLIDNRFTDEIKQILTEDDIINKLESIDKSLSINCNIFYGDILKNPNVSNKFGILENLWDFPNIIGTLLSTFDYRPNLVELNIINNFIQYLDLFEDNIAIHFRTGGDGDWDDPVVDTSENIIYLIDKVREIVGENNKNTCVYFATDSALLKKKILTEYGEEFNMISIEIPLVHVDRTSGNEQISGTRFAIMENYLISMCNHILTGKGSFSVISSCRKYQWPWRYFKDHK